MSRTSRLLLVVSLAALLAVPGWAGDKLSIRLIQASKDDNKVDEKLADVAAFLTGELPFTSFTQLDAKEVALPADETVEMARSFQVSCKGAQAELSIVVMKDGKEQVLKTVVALTDGKPLVAGPFPAAKGKLLLLLLAR